MNFRFLFPVLAVIILSLGSLFYLWPELRSFYPELLPTSNSVPLTTPIEEPPTQTKEREIVAPPPIQAIKEDAAAALTRTGVIELTNDYRLANGIKPLEENVFLDAAAKAKVEDMFKYQYFAHESPTGLNAGGFVQSAGYDYLIVGENLAEGNFKDDETLVQAWINSSGHRANILNVKFTEIGVAVGQGLWNGKLTWLAVQEFAMPVSLCTQPNEFLRSEIDDNKSQIDSWTLLLEAKKAELDSLGPAEWREYNRKVEEYNNLVVEYNALIEETKILVSTYNSQVAAFNNCIK